MGCKITTASQQSNLGFHKKNSQIYKWCSGTACFYQKWGSERLSLLLFISQSVATFARLLSQVWSMEVEGHPLARSEEVWKK